MFIVWGTKRVEGSLGTVADFCPICRDIRSFHLLRIGMASHVYYISSGEGQLAGHIIQCDTCKVRLGVDPTRYAKVELHPQNMDSLAGETFPRLREFHAERLKVEDQIKTSLMSISTDQRKYLLMEPFALLNPQVEQRFANSNEMDKKSGIGCLATLLLGGGFFFWAIMFRGPAQDRMLIAGAVLFGIGTIYTFIQLHLGPGRSFHAHLVPLLLKSMKPLRPTRDELTDCIDRCKSLGMKIGKVAKIDAIWPRMERAIAGFDN